MFRIVNTQKLSATQKVQKVSARKVAQKVSASLIDVLLRFKFQCELKIILISLSLLDVLRMNWVHRFGVCLWFKSRQ